jgi:succinate dehydrogenase/fumarate reductase flavoprotein subunit
VKKTSITRRDLFKGTAVLGAGAAAASVFGSLVGCSDPKKEKGMIAVTASGRSFAVHGADIVVVGGGMAGMNAARVANNRGASVILVDKGPLGHSGNSGVLWGQTFVSSENTHDNGEKGAEFITIDVMGILDQEQARNVSRAHIEAQPRSMIEQAGNMFQRDDAGNTVGVDAQDEISVTHNALHKQQAQALRRRGIPVFEHTMMIDVLVYEGQAAGIVAIDLFDGSAHVFRGKKVILCTGGYHWASGKTGGGPESTGEGHLALLKRGLAFKDMEFPQYDFCGIHPFGYRPDKEKDAIEIAVTYPLNGEIHHRIYNSDKQSFTNAFFEDPEVQSIASFQGTLITAAKELYQGKGTPGDGTGNGVYFGLAGIMEEPNTQSYPSYKGITQNVIANMGYAWPDYLECVANEYSSCGVPRQDPATCESEIPGLYTVFVALSAMSSMWNWGQSYLAGGDAAKKAASVKALPAYGIEDVDAALTQAYGMLSAQPKDGIRSTEVHRKIQRAFYRGQDFMKDEEGMQVMLAELERIQKEDVPRMYCLDRSLTCNRDWKMAMEVESMLTCSLATVHAALARKESRSPFFRSDYPKMNNSDYLCYLWTSLDKNGNWKVEKGDITDTVVPRDKIRQILDDSDPRYDISIANKYL